MIKENINKIHYQLTENFSDIQLLEKSDIRIGKYFSISASKDDKKISMIIPFIELEKNRFNWSYSENPLNENSDFIERNSSIDTITDDIKDIFEKKRFSEDYLNALKK